MTTGPTEYIVVAFPGNRFNGEIVPELQALVEAGSIKILDLIFIMKDEDDVVTSIEINDDDFPALDASVGGLISEEDVAYAAERLATNSSAALLIWEDLWAAPFVAALNQSGGVLIEGSRIPHDLVTAALDDLPAAV